MANTKSKQKSTNKKGTNKKKNNSKKGLLLTIAITVVVVAALAVVLTLALGGKSNKQSELLKSTGKHITVTGEQKLLQICDKIDSGIAYTETYRTDKTQNYYTCDGARNYNRATFTDNNSVLDLAELFDGTSGYMIDHTNKMVSKFETKYSDVQNISMLGMYVVFNRVGYLGYVGTAEEELEGEKCSVETYTLSSEVTGENTIKAYFYEDTLVAIVTGTQDAPITWYVELVEGADASKLTYTQLEGYTELF